MKTYLWIGRDSFGIFTQGRIKTSSPALAKALLTKRGIYVDTIRPQRRLKQGLSARELALFIRQLATLVKAHIPLIQALSIIRQESFHHPELQDLVATLQGDLEKGISFSETLRRHPHYFAQLTCSLILVGERSGTLDNTLEMIAAHQERELALKQKIKKALFYPSLILIVSILVGISAFVLVVPQFEQLFASVNAELPLLTRWVIHASTLLLNYGWLGVITIGLTIYLLSKITLKLPIVGPLLQKIIISRFARTLAVTFKAGIPITDGIRLLKGVLIHHRYERALSAIYQGISQGKKLNHVLHSLKLFPPTMIQMVAIGEESGSLDFMLHKIADIYTEQVLQTIERLTELIEPAVLVIVGVLVGTVVLALYWPIFQLGNVIAS